MRITIVADDDAVGVGGVFRKVDLSDLDRAIHAVQWDTLAGRGEIEYRDNFRPNEEITDFNPYQAYRDRWAAATPPPPTLGEVKGARVGEAKAVLARRLAAGFAHTVGDTTRTYQLDEGSQARIVAAAQWAELAKAGLAAWPADFAWRDGGNTFQPLTADEMIAFAAAAAGRVLAERRALWAHVDTIRGYTTIAEVEAHDLAAGWPA